jgi:formylmethanofuran dehydrogenase subunit E-like metal-binding protein
MIHNIKWPQGTSSFISILSHDSNSSDLSSAVPDNNDVFFLRHYALLDISVGYNLLGDFNLHNPLCGGVQATPDPMARNYISFFNAHFLLLLLPQGFITCS